MTKTQVLFPKDIDSMLERIDALLELSELFFTPRSMLVQNLSLFVTKCRQKKLLLKTCNHLDDQFITKLLYSIDDRVNKWLNECMRAKSIADTSLELVTFVTILTDIQLNRFICFLPSNIKRLSKPIESKEDNFKSPNKKARSETQTSNQVKNNNVIEECRLVRHENWSKLFQGKSKEGEILSCGTYPCIKYHVKGVCYDDCAFKGSHRRLTGSDEEKVKKLVSKLRRE